MHFLGKNKSSDLQSAIEANSVSEKQEKAREEKKQQQTLQWYLKRLGKITGSRYKDVKFDEIKISKASAKPKLIEWLLNNNASEKIATKLQELGFSGIDLAIPSKLTIPQLKELIDETPGKRRLSKASFTYMEELIAECRLNSELLKSGKLPKWFNSTSQSMNWGINHESVAFSKYAEKIKANVSEVGLSFLTNDKVIAASSDAVIFDDQGNKIGVGEIKCPWDYTNHSRFLSPIKLNTEKDFIYFTSKKSYENIFSEQVEFYDKRYFRQYLGNMLIHDVEYCDFISFDPRMKNEKDKIFVVRLYAEDYQEEINQLKKDLIEFKEIYLKELERLGLKVPYC